MIKMDQVRQLRVLHDAEKEAYLNTHKNGSMAVYEEWVKACDELNQFIATIAEE